MKTEFIPEYIYSNKGCYNKEDVDKLPFITKELITIQDLFDGLFIKDFTWFLAKKTELTNKQKVSFAIHCAEFVVPIYEKKYPNDLRVRECVQAVKDFEDGKITCYELLEKRSDAASASAASAAAAAASAASAAASAASAAAAADADADAAYAAAAYAAYAADADAYKQHVLTWVNKNK